MKRILIIEDTDSIREELVDILTLEDYDVFEAENGKVGIDQALKNLPDLIICDILMPVLNGFEFFNLLKSEKSIKHIPVIFLSAKANKEDIEKGKKLGVVDYLVKPISIDALIDAITKII